MTNTFSDIGPRLTDQDITAVEEQFGVRFPAQLRAHYLAQNGGEPTRRCWPAPGDDPTCLKAFLTIRPAGPEGEALDDGNTVQDTLRDLLDGPHIPPDLLPFADDWGGNYFCVHQQSGAVYWFAMDLGDDFDRARRYLTNSFASFMDGLIQDEDG